MTDVKQTIKTTTFQIANRMGIDSKHPKVRNFSVKFKAFSKDENHVQARAYAIPYVTNDIYKKYPKQDYPSKDVAWFDVEVIFNTAFVKENAHKINTPPYTTLSSTNYRTSNMESKIIVHSSIVMTGTVKNYLKRLLKNMPMAMT